MTHLTAADQAILRKLIAKDVITVEAGEALIRELALHRAKDPDHCMTDLLIEKHLLVPSQVNALLALFSGDISGTIRKVTIRGRLDLDWALKQLDR